MRLDAIRSALSARHLTKFPRPYGVSYGAMGFRPIRMIRSPFRSVLVVCPDPVFEFRSLTIIFADVIVLGAMLSNVALCAFDTLVQVTVCHAFVFVKKTERETFPAFETSFHVESPMKLNR